MSVEKEPLRSELLEAISGGADVKIADGYQTKCPKCGSANVTMLQIVYEVPSYIVADFKCNDCGTCYMDIVPK